MMQVDRPGRDQRLPDAVLAQTAGWSLDFSVTRRLARRCPRRFVPRRSARPPVAALRGPGYDPASDPNSMYNTTAYTGAHGWWNAGYTGEGVDVALIDTGRRRRSRVSPARQDHLRPRPVARVAGAEPRTTSTRTATGRSWPG